MLVMGEPTPLKLNVCDGFIKSSLVTECTTSEVISCHLELYGCISNIPETLMNKSNILLGYIYNNCVIPVCLSFRHLGNF